MNTVDPILMFLLFAWSVVWKGIALWKAAKDNQKNWFISLLVLNTVGILEIAYLLYYAKHKIKVPVLERWGLT